MWVIAIATYAYADTMPTTATRPTSQAEEEEYLKLKVVAAFLPP
jgi:hypothetical protein